MRSLRKIRVNLYRRTPLRYSGGAFGGELSAVWREGGTVGLHVTHSYGVVSVTSALSIRTFKPERCGGLVVRWQTIPSSEA